MLTADLPRALCKAFDKVFLRVDFQWRIQGRGTSLMDMQCIRALPRATQWRVSFPGLVPTLWQVGENTGYMDVLRRKFSIIRASFFWGDFFSWQSWNVQNAIHAWFQNSSKTSQNKVIMEQFRETLINERREKKFWQTVGIFLIIGDSDSVVLYIDIQFQYIYDVQCVDLTNRWPIAFYCAMHEQRMWFRPCFDRMV